MVGAGRAGRALLMPRLRRVGFPWLPLFHGTHFKPRSIWNDPMTFRTHSITFTMSSVKTLTKRMCPGKACTSQTLTWKSVPTQIYGHYVTSAKRFLPTTKTMVISPLIHHQFTLTNLNQPLPTPNLNLPKHSLTPSQDARIP